MQSKSASLVVLALTSTLSLGCSHTRQAESPKARAAEGANFDTAEADILGELAAVDRRLAKRAHVTPSEDAQQRLTMAAVLREDPTLAVVDGSIDPFSFDARLRGLDDARAKVLALPQATGDQHASERALLARLVDSEKARLDEERALPRSSSALVRAIVDTWQPPSSAEEAASSDRWLARRLASVREAMSTPSEPTRDLDVVRARELDDALDALERLATMPGFTTATQELVLVREALEAVASRPAAKAESDWPLVARRAKVHLGLDETPDDLGRRLGDLERDLRSRAERAMADASVSLDTLGPNVAGHVMETGPCLDAVPGSRVRSMASPQEREPSCHLRHFIARSDGDFGDALALVVMHEHVVVAEWALEVASGKATIAEAEGRHRSLVPLAPGVRARYERIALARPVAAIGAGESVGLLVGGEPKARAAAWANIGDVPLDIARAELGAR